MVVISGDKTLVPVHARFLLNLLLVIMLSHGRLQAQRFSGGLSLGLVATDISGAENRHPHNVFIKMGYSAGGLINVKMNDKWRFQFELNYTLKGSYLPQDSHYTTYYKIALSYVEMPLLFKRKVILSLPKKGWDRLELEAGFSIGKLLNYAVTGYSNYVIPAGKDPFNSYEPAILLGADYRLTKHFYFCFRYSNGFIPVVKHGTQVSTLRRLTYNRGNNMVLLFSIKFIFNAGKDGRNSKPDMTVE